MAPLDFYFEKKMHAELPWWQRQCALPFEKVERLSHVNWHDVGMHTVLSYTGMEVEFPKRMAAHQFGGI